MTDTRTSKDVTTCATHAPEHRLRGELPCPWCAIDELKRNRDALEAELKKFVAHTIGPRAGHEPRAPLSDDQLIAIADQFDSSGCAGAIHRYQMRRRDMIALLRSFSGTVEGMVRDGASQPPSNDAVNAARWRHAVLAMCHSFDGHDRTYYLKASGRQSFEALIDERIALTKGESHG